MLQDTRRQQCAFGDGFGDERRCGVTEHVRIDTASKVLGRHLQDARIDPAGTHLPLAPVQAWPQGRADLGQVVEYGVHAAEIKGERRTQLIWPIKLKGTAALHLVCSERYA